MLERFCKEAVSCVTELLHSFIALITHITHVRKENIFNKETSPYIQYV